MIKKLFFLAAIFLFLAANGLSQDKATYLDSLRQKLENFDYTGTINLADSLLKFINNPTPSQLLEIYRMKGISEFSLQEDQAAKKSFLSILGIDKNYELDSAKTSPKIISFFDDIKKDYEDNGMSTIMEKIKMEKRFGNCQCATKNPKGK